MSIIYDALKKTEETVHPHNPPDPEVEAALKKKRAKKKVRSTFLYIFVICVGLYAGNIFFDLLGKTKGLLKPGAQKPPAAETPRVAVTQKLPSSPKPKETSILQNIPLLSSELKKDQKQTLDLNGVFFSQEGGYALINNRMVQVGDTVNGAVVRRIDLDEVDLERNGAIITLSTK